MSQWHPGLNALPAVPAPWKPFELVDAKPRGPIAPVKMVSLAVPWRPNPILAWGVLFGIICWLLRDLYVAIWWLGPAW